MQRLSEFFVGLIFGIGLILAGMTDPGKVIGFLDLFGAWDPSLALVMGGAILVGVFAFAVAKRRTTSFFGGAMQLPTARHVDRRLIVGSLALAPAGAWRVSARGQRWCRWALARSRPPCSCWPCWPAWRCLKWPNA